MRVGMLVGHLAGFVFGSLSVIAVVSLTLALTVAVEVPTTDAGFRGALVAATEDARYIGPATVLQTVGLSMLALALGALLPRPPKAGVREVFALQWPSLPWTATAVVGGALVWIWPSWFAAQLVEWTGWESSVVAIGQMLAGPLDEVWPMVLAVTLGAPISEELLFRGYLWRLVEAGTGRPEPRLAQRRAFVLTTLLFALYHVDPIHIVALLPTAAFFGWLRYASGSLWPSVIAHFVNNTLAVIIVQLTPGELFGPGLSLLGGLLFVGVVVAGSYLARD